MGNESSQLSGLEIEEKAIEVTDFWCHYQATINDSCRYFSLKGDGSVSVFKGEAAVGPLWSISTPLEKFSNVCNHRVLYIYVYDLTLVYKSSMFFLESSEVPPSVYCSIYLGLATAFYSTLSNRVCAATVTYPSILNASPNMHRTEQYFESFGVHS